MRTLFALGNWINDWFKSLDERNLISKHKAHTASIVAHYKELYNKGVK